MIYILILCFIIIVFLGIKLFQKRKEDTKLLEVYTKQLEDTEEKLSFNKEALEQYRGKLLDLQIKTNTEQQKLTDLYNQLDSAQTSLQDARDEYHHLVNDKMKEIDETIEAQRQKRERELNQALEEKQNYYNKILEDTINRCNLQNDTVKEASEIKWREAMEQIEQYNKSITQAKERFESIEHTLAQYEKDKQAKLFYTIQLPDEYKDDIEFLLTTVAAKVQHPDIISKLVWAEYVKPNLDDTFKRIEIKASPGIYKITNIDTGKCYIGKSTNVKTRIADHFKSSIGIRSIADQAVHHAILKEGFWNWAIEVITYCDKEQLNELEKYYIDFFKAQEHGYNKNAGG